MRCNVGVKPHYLADQHLIAEYRELLMVIGQLKQHGWKIKSKPPNRFSLGTGHMNWFKSRLMYLKRRHDDIKYEMCYRGFKCDNLTIDCTLYPPEFVNDWSPTLTDSLLLRQRISERLFMKPNFYKYFRVDIESIDYFSSVMMNSELWTT